MALTRRCDSVSLKSNGGLRILRYTRSFGRKRILISDFGDFVFPIGDYIPNLEKRTVDFEANRKSELESLPQDVLIRILCGVDHSDLKQLFGVSTVIREAAKVAEKMHFAYSTPKKKTGNFRWPVDLPENFDGIETPKAPKQLRNYESKLNRKKLAELAVQLFASPEKELLA